MPYLEDYIPVVKYHGLNTQKDIDSEGSSRLAKLVIPVTSADATNLGAATCSAMNGLVTSNFNIAAGTIYRLTITNTNASANDLIFASIHPFTSTGTPYILSVASAGGSIAVKYGNLSDGVLMGTGSVKVGFMLVKGL